MTCIEFLIEVVGFFLQTIPVAVFAFIPFSDKEIKLPRKKLLTNTLLIETAASVLFGVAEYLFATYWHSVNMNPYMVMYIVLMAVLFFRVVDSPVINKMMVAILLLHYAAVVFVLLEWLVFINDGRSSGYMYSFYDDVLYLVVAIVTAPVVYIFLKQVVWPAMLVIGRKTMRRGCAYAGMALFLFCFALFIYDTYLTDAGWEGVNIILVLTLIVTDAIIYYMFFSESKLAAENQSLENQIISYNDQYRRISSNIEETRRMRHDIRHHLNIISDMNNRGEYEELAKYLESYAQTYSELENTVMSGYSPIDNILGYYIASAKQQGIQVKIECCHLPSDVGFEVPDITAMLGNLMENAIEACERVEDDMPRFVRIRIRQNDVSLLIYIENSCVADGLHIDFTDESKFVSTKHSRSGGQGLRSVRLVAEKYGGSAEFKKQEGVFAARLVLNMP